MTHNMRQAARVSDYTAMMMMRSDRAGEMIETVRSGSEDAQVVLRAGA